MTDFITEEMVSAARQAWLESASDYTRLDVSIRAALTAALPLVIEECAKVADEAAKFSGEKMKEAFDLGPAYNVAFGATGEDIAFSIRSLLPTTTKETT